MQIKLIFTRKVVHLTSFWKWGFLEIGSGLFLIVTIQKKATELYFLVVLFIMLYKVILTFEFKCDCLNETFSAVFLCSSV